MQRSVEQDLQETGEDLFLNLLQMEGSQPLSEAKDRLKRIDPQEDASLREPVSKLFERVIRNDTSRVLTQSFAQDDTLVRPEPLLTPATDC